MPEWVVEQGECILSFAPPWLACLQVQLAQSNPCQKASLSVDRTPDNALSSPTTLFTPYLGDPSTQCKNILTPVPLLYKNIYLHYAVNIFTVTIVD